MPKYAERVCRNGTNEAVVLDAAFKPHSDLRIDRHTGATTSLDRWENCTNSRGFASTGLKAVGFLVFQDVTCIVLL